MMKQNKLAFSKDGTDTMMHLDWLIPSTWTEKMKFLLTSFYRGNRIWDQ